MGLVRRSCLGSLLIPVLVLVVALGVLGLGADRGAVWVVGRAVESGLRDEGARSPHVSFGGFPFLDQLLHRDFSSVRVRAATVRHDGLIGRDLVATLTGVRPNGSREVHADTVNGHLVVDYAEVERVSKQPAGSLSTRGSSVQVRRTVTVLGASVTAVALARVRVSGDRLLVTPTSVSVAGVSTGSLLRSLTAELSAGYAFEGLPPGLRVTAVRPVTGGLLVQFTGRQVTLTR